MYVILLTINCLYVFQQTLISFDTSPGSELFNKYGVIVSEINYYFDENCKLIKLTKVHFSGHDHNYIKQCEKIVLNGKGDIIKTVDFILNNRKTQDFEYYDDDEEYIKENNLFEECYYSAVEYEYEYDNNNNWVTKKTGNVIYRREINYRKTN